MSHLFVINKHSFVDLITNSSSELFVCNTNKSIEMIKNLLTKLIETHSELSGVHYTYNGCFGKIEEAKYTYDLEKFDESVVLTYKSYNESCHLWNDEQCRYNGILILPPPSFSKAEREIESLRNEYPLPCYRNYSKMTDEEKKLNDKLFSERRKKEEVIWTEFGAEKTDVEGKLFIEFLKFNGCSNTDIEKIQEIINRAVKEHREHREHREHQKGDYGHFWYLDEDELSTELIEAWDFFRMTSGYGLTIKKGQILVNSNGGNSIPYELFELLDEYLSAKHYHLG